MATFIRIEGAGGRRAVLVGAIALASWGVCASEAEIHVSVGADGIEIFSNLPRGPLPGANTPLRPLPGPTAMALVRPLTEPDETSRIDEETTAPGKTFLVDD